MQRAAARAFALVLLAASAASAHPSVSVVRDARGNVYYSDLKQVWRIAPDGTRSIAVRGVHTHELWADASGLYGEHLWYEGEKTDVWGHRVWRLAPDGVLSDVVRARQGFRREPSFVRDAAGAQYWTEVDGAESVVKRRSADGVLAEVARLKPRDPRWMTAAADGTVFLVDLDDLVRVTPAGAVATLARNLTGSRKPRRHDVQGLFPGRDGSVYVAVSANRRVVNVSPDGTVREAARSRFPWSPTGGMLDGNGDLWILEWGLVDAVRVRRVSADGRVTVY